jgi:PilZ domain
MPNEPEPRVDVDLAVRVFGMDTDGRPFFQNAHARNISDHGAKLSGLERQLKPGDIIGVQVGDKKARCKVVWVVDAGQRQKIEVGVKMVEGQESPWQQQMQVPRTEAPAPNDVAGEELPPPDKRRFPRRRVRLPIEIRDEAGMQMRTNAADINGRGCYVETLLPLPKGKVLDITFWLDSERVDTPAIVRACDGGVGMGIEFTGLDQKTQERLQQQVDAMAAESEPSQNVQGAV